MESPKLYIIDFLNAFSDFREIKYKKCNIDFHTVKQVNVIQDTLDFFRLFFTKYLTFLNTRDNNKFIFVMKKLHNCTEVLDSILYKYSKIDIQFVIIESRFRNNVLEKNKDDFLCQYLCTTMENKFKDVILISNDKYRDRTNYVNLFTSDIIIQTCCWNRESNSVKKHLMIYNVNNSLRNNILKSTYNRCSIPKYKLNKMM